MNKLTTNRSKILTSELFLGIDGGQSHTEAIISNKSGNILGRGFGGALDHPLTQGGGERLRNSILSSVGEALKNADLLPISKTTFASVHCGMSGGAIYKEEIIRQILKAEILNIGADAPIALLGATAGKPGIVVIAGTGSLIWGSNINGETAQAGGLGYLFSDEGGGFWLAAQIIRLAIKEQDGLIPSNGLRQLVLDFFCCQQLREITDNFYNAKISRDEIASFAKKAFEAALEGNQSILEQIKFGANLLADSVNSVASRLNFHERFSVVGVGGMFRAVLMDEFFRKALVEKVQLADLVKPQFGPAIGALLQAYTQANIKITENLLNNLRKFSNEN